MTRTEAAIVALYTVLKVAAGQPESRLVMPTRNRDIGRMMEALDGGGDGATATLNLRDGSADIVNEMLGDTLCSYEIEHTAELEWAVSDTDQPTRDALFDRGLEVIAATIEAAAQPDEIHGGLPLLGTVSNIRIARVERSSLVTDGAPQIKAAVIFVELLFCSPRPF